MGIINKINVSGTDYNFTDSLTGSITSGSGSGTSYSYIASSSAVDSYYNGLQLTLSTSSYGMYLNGNTTLNVNSKGAKYFNASTYCGLYYIAKYSYITIVYYNNQWWLVDTIQAPEHKYVQTEHTYSCASLAAYSNLQVADGATISNSGFYPLFISGFTTPNRFTSIVNAYFSSVSPGSATISCTVRNGRVAKLGTDASVTLYVVWERIE